MDKNYKKYPKRIVIEVPEDFHKKVKNHATELGISVRLLAIRALINEIEKDI